MLLLAFTLQANAGDALRVVVLDVGEGQSILLKRGDRGVLVDTGHLGKARHVLDRLAAHGVRRLDYLVLTHLHPDHASGYFRIREAFPQARVLDNGQEIPPDFTPDTVRWVHRALERDSNRCTVRAGDVIRWENVQLRVLWPDRPEGPDLNRNSLVLEARFREQSLLIMGDVGRAVESRLLDRGVVPDRVALLVAGHHGSAETAGPEFLNVVQPGVSVVSVNADNVRGYPDSGTVARLRRHSDKVYETYRDGEIVLALGSEPETVGN